MNRSNSTQQSDEFRRFPCVPELPDPNTGTPESRTDAILETLLVGVHRAMGVAPAEYAASLPETLALVRERIWINEQRHQLRLEFVRASDALRRFERRYGG